MKRLFTISALLIAVGLIIFAVRKPAPPPPVSAKPAVAPQKASTPLQVVLTPLGGEAEVDQKISKLQQKIKLSPDMAPALLERLGWTFVEKARISSDPGYYKLAEQCADAMAQAKPDSPDSELLRGHIYHALHRFKDAETVARKLVAQRTFVFDYALLGDALMEQGRLEEAVPAYQKMVDLKPCLQTYSRIAHMRWLKGDLPGAVQAIRYAVTGGSILEPEPVAWAYTKLALYSLQAGEKEVALRATDLATQYVPDYAAALLMRGRILMAQGKSAEAVPALEKAADKSPLPEYLWTLADALRAEKKSGEAAAVEKKLRATGTANDPRTYSLYLASRGEQPDIALRLAAAELKARHDIFTQDAVAWAEFAQGNFPAARASMEKALAEGTKDGRLFYHAAVINAAAGRIEQAQDFFRQAEGMKDTLLPSERAAMQQKMALLPRHPTQVSSR